MPALFLMFWDNYQKKVTFFNTFYRLLEPCDGCAAPYGYKHHMRLSTDTSTFSVSIYRWRNPDMYIFKIYDLRIMHFRVEIILMSSLFFREIETI